MRLLWPEGQFTYNCGMPFLATQRTTLIPSFEGLHIYVLFPPASETQLWCGIGGTLWTMTAFVLLNVSKSSRITKVILYHGRFRTPYRCQLLSSNLVFFPSITCTMYYCLLVHCPYIYFQKNW